MKLSRAVCLCLGLFAACRTVRGTEPSAEKPELRGVLATATEQRFNLALASTGHSEWVALGETFAGWKVVTYRAADSMLVLQPGDGRELDLTLAATPVITANESATVGDAEAILRKMNFAKMFGKMMDQQIAAMAAMSKQLAGRRGLNRDPAIAEAYQAKAMALIRSALNPEQMESDLAQAYSEVFTKDELTGLGTFFDSPVGQAYMDQMPAVNQKVQAVLMPRILALQPQLQALSQQEATAAATPPPAPAPVPAAPPKG